MEGDPLLVTPIIRPLMHCYGDALISCRGPAISSGDERPNGGGSPPGDGPVPSPPHHHSRPPAKRTPQQVAGEAVIERLVAEVDGSCFSFRSGDMRASCSASDVVVVVVVVVVWCLQ